MADYWSLHGLTDNSVGDMTGIVHQDQTCTVGDILAERADGVQPQAIR